MPDTHEINRILEDARKRMENLRQTLDIKTKTERVDAIDGLMSQPDFWNDQARAQAVIAERKTLKSVLDPLEELNRALEESEEFFQMAVEEDDEETLAEIGETIADLPGRIASLETMALLSHRGDSEGCFFSIHTGAGGSDACEWAEILLRMYTRFFEKRGWKIEELSFVAGEEAGIRGVDLRVSGPYVFGHMKGEIGVHRLVRISPYSGRRETSFAAVDAVPDFEEEINIEIDEKDLRIDTYRAGGKGGQHVNTTDSAVRITHLPTGIVAAVQNERSQHANKAVAMKILKSRLDQRAEAERMAQSDAHNAAKMENAWGSQIRNYVMHPYSLVKDVRTGHETGNIQAVLDGDLDDFIDAYLHWQIETPGANAS